MSLTVPSTPRIVPLPTGILANMTKHYAPFSIRESLDVGSVAYALEVASDTEMKAMKFLFDQKGAAFRMYGSPEELWDHAKVYIDFQGNNKYFKLDPSIHYNHTLQLYRDVQGTNEFIKKNDIFLYMQNFLLDKDNMLKLRLPLIMLTYLFKFEERKLEDTCEFIAFNKEEFKQLDSDLMNLLIKMKTPGGAKFPTMQLNWKRVFAKFRKLLPESIKESEMAVLGGVVKSLFSGVQCTLQQSAGISILMYTYCSTLIPGLQKIINSRPQWFLPNSKLNPKISVSIKPVVRVFQYNNSQHMLTREVENALNNNSHPWKDRPSTRLVEVVEFEDAPAFWKNHGKAMEDTDFILVPTTNTKHCFSPIQDGTGLFCKPAMEVFLEMFDNLCFGSNVFQRVNSKTSATLTTLLDKLSAVFFTELEKVYFIDQQVTLDMEATFVAKLHKKDSSNVIRDVPPKGFTSEDVKAELKHLQVEAFLSDVCDYTEVAYQKVLTDKKQMTLRTCDMYDAVRICMLLSVFKKFPNLAKFVHQQKACHRIHGHQCSYCEAEKLEPRKTKKQYVTFYESLDPSTSGMKQNKETGLPFAKVIKMDILNEDLEFIEEDLSQPVKPAPKPVEKVPKVKKEKEPTTCEKCIRTIERCQSAKNENKACIKRMDDIGAEMDILKYSISDLKKKEAELHRAVEEKYGNQLALVLEQLSTLKKKGEQDLENIQKLEIKVTEQEKEIEGILKTETVDLKKIKADMEESNEKLQNANANLVNRNKEKGVKIKHLKEEIEPIQKSRASITSSKPSPASSGLSSSTTPSKTTNSEFNPSLIAQMLHDFQKMREDLEKSNFLRHARAKVNELITLTEDDQVKSTAKYELDRITREFKATLKKLDENINMIQKNHRIPISQLHKIQKRPTFSPHFLEEYNRAIAKENQPGELDDTECLICIQNMEPGEATVKCSKCRRRYHTECASDWLSTKTVCPTCDRAMLHPMDYPPLN